MVGYQHTKVCLFIIYTYCVTEFETIFCGLIFWRLFFQALLAPNKNISQMLVFLQYYGKQGIFQLSLR